ncbi:T9SS type A sorting domain-containing protein [Flavobacterium sp. 3HN19-14]|uniref:T9SS type A sorting domain-containing protein n=1 Tax=Flavobacterium sp. 3HN19-14 TaxID=3448133 RepID=UPI003EE30ED2
MKKLLSLSSLLFCFILLFNTANAFAQDDEGDDETAVDTHAKIRLGFYSHANSYRQILLGFENENATEGIDYGYDAVNTLNLPNDMYFWTANTELFIQGVGYWSAEAIYPIGVRSNGTGSIIIKIDALENMNPSQPIYIYDAQNDSYFDLKNGNFTATVADGVFNDRFSLRFAQTTLGVNNPSLNTGIKVAYTNGDSVLNIQNNLSGTTAKTVNLYSITGQQVGVWNIENQNQSAIAVPVTGFSKGVYIVNVNTTSGIITKKIIIN